MGYVAWRRRSIWVGSMLIWEGACTFPGAIRHLHFCIYIYPRTSDFYFTVKVPEINTIVKHTLRHNQRLFSQYVNILHSICHNKIDIGIPRPLSQCHHTQHKTHVSPTVVAEQETCVSHPHPHSYYHEPHSNILTHNQAVVPP